MKNILLTLVILLVGLTYSQTTKTTYFDGGKIVTFELNKTLASGTTYYSDPIDIAGYVPFDSIQAVSMINYQVTDTPIVTITLEGRNATNAVQPWQTAIGTLVTNCTGGDTSGFYWLKLFGAYTNARGATLNGFFPTQVRLKILFTTPTSYATNGYVRVWLKFKKQ